MTSVALGVFTIALFIPAVVLHAIARGVPALFQVGPIGADFRHTVDPMFNLLVPRQVGAGSTAVAPRFAFG